MAGVGTKKGRSVFQLAVVLGTILYLTYFLGLQCQWKLAVNQLFHWEPNGWILLLLAINQPSSSKFIGVGNKRNVYRAVCSTLPSHLRASRQGRVVVGNQNDVIFVKTETVFHRDGRGIYRNIMWAIPQRRRSPENLFSYFIFKAPKH